MDASDRVLLVIPTYNERATIEPLLRAVLAASDRVDVLVVDDASPDRTAVRVAELAEGDPRLSLIVRSGKQGLGSAYRLGLGRALAAGYGAAGEMDADLSHDPADVPRLLVALEEGADLAIGSRYVDGGRIVGWPAHRLALSRAGNAYVRAATGCPVADATAGFRLYRAPLLSRLDLASVASEGYSFQVELVLRAWQAGARIAEVPVIFTERRHGASKLGRAVIAEAVARVAGWGWQVRRGRPLAG